MLINPKSCDGAHPFCSCSGERTLPVLACYVVLLMYSCGTEIHCEVYLMPIYLRLARVRVHQLLITCT